MQAPLRDILLLWRAERLVVEIRTQALVRQVALVAFAALIALFGLGMVNLAAFFYLQPMFGPGDAALCVAAADFALVILALLAALFMRPGRDLTMATELRDAAWNNVGNGARRQVESVLGAGASIGTMLANPVASLGPAMVLSMIRAILRGFGKSKKPE